jgi:nucleotide-binding universal stress UspA family protein
MPFRTRSILVAADISESALRVLRAAGALTALTEANLHVVHAMEPGAKDPAGFSTELTTRTLSMELQAQLRMALPGPVDATSARVLAGDPVEVIVRRAEEVEADLIVAGPHRRHTEAGGDLGSTADRLVRTSALPCLIVRGELSLPLRRVLVPSDLSEASSGALDIALIWAAALRMPKGSEGATVVEVLHVCSSGTADDPAGRGDCGEQVEEALRIQVAEASERTGLTAPLQIRSTTETADDIGAAIVGRASRDTADLLVLGTHGESAQERELIGSVSSAVAQTAECPVLLVPPGLWQVRQAREEKLRRGGSGPHPGG